MSQAFAMAILIQPPQPLASIAFSARPSKRIRLTPVTCSAEKPHVAVVGGGAAGLAAAYFAADSGAQVTVLEKNADPGKKILISGGTRCNILPAAVDLATDYFTESSTSALRSIFSRWSLEDCEQWLSDPSQIGIELSLEEETQKLFPASNDAKEVRDRLVDACKQRGVTFIPSAALVDLAPSTSTDSKGTWACIYDNGAPGNRKILEADRVIMATGGKSFPALGTIGTGYEILRRLGHTLHSPYAALTPLLGRHPGAEQLPGLSIYTAQLSLAESGSSGNTKSGGKKKGRNRPKSHTAERTALLLTHRGFSGPAAMDLAHFYSMAQERGQTLPQFSVSWIQDMDKATWEQELTSLAAAKGGGGASPVTSVLRRHGVPARLADALCAQANIPVGRKLSEMRKEEKSGLLEALTACTLDVTGHEGYPKAEVTGGGVPLNHLDCAVMESRVLPGVHVCGELCDVHGRIGGFNFYWAWCSGRLAGIGAATGLS